MFRNIHNTDDDTILCFMLTSTNKKYVTGKIYIKQGVYNGDDS